MKTKNNHLITLAALILLSCGGNNILPVAQRPINVKQTAEFAAHQLVGYQAVTFRTINSEGDEFKDAYCEVSGRGFTANMLTPAIVMIPNFGRQSGDIVVYCRYHDQPISQVFHVNKNRKVNLSPVVSGIGTAVGGPITGAIVGVVTDTVTRDPVAEYGYDEVITVRFP